MKLDDKQKENVKMSLGNIIGESFSETKLNNVLNSIERELQEPLPEKILKCTKCKNDIIAYGEKGEAFVTVHDEIDGDKHYHMGCKD